ncbi:MAG: DUF2461 domain-containing protein [Vicinamibacterales bacterium]
MAEPVFSKKTLAFLRALKRNNDREWFKAHKDDYETHVRGPLVRLLGRLETDLAGFAPEFVSHPKVSLFRPYRDTRFSSDKSPLKTNAAAHFPSRHLLKRGGGLYLEVTPGWVWIGGGIYMPDATDLLRIRERIARDRATLRRILKARSFVSAVGSMQGATLTRVPRGFLPDHPAADLLRHKQFLAAKEYPAAFAYDPAFYPELLTVFRAITPMVRYFNDAMAGA